MPISKRFFVKVFLKRMIIISFVIMIFMMTIAGANGERKSVLMPNSDFSKLFPGNESFYGETVQFGGKICATVNNSVEIDPANGDIDIAIVSKEFEYRGSFDNYFKLKNSVFLFKDKDLVKLVGHDKRVTDAELPQKYSIRYYLNDKQKDVKQITYDNNTVDSDILLFYLQGKLLEGNSKFNISLISKGNGMKVNAVFRRLLTADLQKLSPEYNFPSEMKKLLEQKVERYVYIMDLSGVAKIFYPYRYYYIYTKESPHNLIAYWGGSPKTAEYAYVL